MGGAEGGRRYWPYLRQTAQDRDQWTGGIDVNKNKILISNIMETIVSAVPVPLHQPNRTFLSLGWSYVMCLELKIFIPANRFIFQVSRKYSY